MRETALLVLALFAWPLLAAEIEVDTYDELLDAAESAGPGDTVRVMPGLYPGGFSIARSGTPDGWISFVAEPGVVVDGSGSTRGIKVAGRSYVRVVGFEVRNVKGPGVEILGQGSHIEVIGVRTRDTGSSGIAVWGRPWESDPAACNYDCLSDVLVRDSVVERSNSSCISGGGYNEGITVASGVRRVRVEGNTVRGNRRKPCGEPGGWDTVAGGEGIDLKEGVRDAWVVGNRVYDLDKNAIYIDAGGSNCHYPETYSRPGTLSNVHVVGNYVRASGDSGINVVSEGSGIIDGVYVYNNVVRDVMGDGILLYDWDSDDKPCSGAGDNTPTYRRVRVFQNTLYKNRRGGVGLDHAWSQEIDIRGNLVVGRDPLRKRVVSGVNADVHDANVLSEIDQGFFMSVDDDDFQLKNSPAVDRGQSEVGYDGTPLHFDRDYGGRSRRQGTRYDHGAYEYRNGPDAPGELAVK